MDSNRIDFTTETLLTVIRNQNIRLANGLRYRQQMHAALEEGCTPDGYRYDWIKDSVIKVVETLENISIEFNRLHPNDRVSVQDYVDILNSTLLTIKRDL